jgi:hypothetical protein
VRRGRAAMYTGARTAGDSTRRGRRSTRASEWNGQN